VTLRIRGETFRQHPRTSPLAPPPTCGTRPRLQGRPVGDPVEPIAERILVADGARPSSEYEEDGLKGVLGIVMVVEDTSTEVQDHGSVALYQNRKGILSDPLLSGDESL
jgi:hypothetical protein